MIYNFAYGDVIVYFVNDTIFCVTSLLLCIFFALVLSPLKK